MRRLFGTVRPVALSTAIEGLQQPVVMLLSLACFVLVALQPVVQMHVFGEYGRLTRDCGMGFLLVFGVLVAASLVFGLRARAAARGGSGPDRAFALCGLLVLAMAVRELDGFFDALLFHGAWALVDGVLLAVCLAVLLRPLSRTARDFADFAAGPECPLFVAGLALAVLFAQGIGSKQVWRHVFDVPFWNDAIAPLRTPEGELPGEIDVFRHVKNTVEESFELAGYLLVLASAALPPLLAPRRREPS